MIILLRFALVISVHLVVAVLLRAGTYGLKGNVEGQPVPVSRQSESAMLVVGEELEYKVSYSFFHLGKIVIKVIDRQERNGRVIYRAQAIIDSAPSLPFVDLHIRFESEFDSDLYSYMWTAEDSTKKEILVRRLVFDYDSSRVFAEKGKKNPDGSFAVEHIDTVKITDHCQDGLSLFYFARARFRQQGQMNVPTFIEKEQVNTFFNFANEQDEEEVDAIQYPVEVVLFDGRADFVGVFGLTGGFRGRFSNDSAGVPIVARMNVILGSIKVQLDRWHRPGWLAPKYREGN
ncbi:MAG: DUF3108 domain-containing protein [Ignavibacteriales bacterium]|nr:DUF3108 domain-containing protein [Ignavibacteriales bacterium]